MKKLLGLTTISLVAATAIYAVETPAGKITGELSSYTEKQSTDNNNDSAFSVGSVAVKFESKNISGFKATVGGIVNAKLSEKNDADYDETKKALLTEANVAYENEMITLIAGRQAIDLEWIEDYHNALVAVGKLDKLTLVAGYTRGWTADAYADGSLAKITSIHDATSGAANSAYVLDATYAINDNTTVGAYYMNSSGFFSAIGGKVEAKVAGLNATAKYAQTNEDVTGVEDGSILAVDLAYKLGEITLNGGYIKAGDKGNQAAGGVGNLATLGDKINPLDSGVDFREHMVVYGLDAKTLYAGVTATLAGFELGAIYGNTKYVLGTQNELNLTLSKEIIDGLKIKALYADITNDSFVGDGSYGTLQLIYSF